MKNVLLLIALLCSSHIYAQTKIVSGKVTDLSSGEELIGVTVLLKGTTTGTVTDEYGMYALATPVSGGSLEFSYLSFESQTVEIGDRSEINVALKPTATRLNEVEVIGYGTQIKEKNTGSISSVNGDQIEGTPASTLEQTLMGKAAGVFIQSDNGKVGSDVRIRIRGSTSISASNEPLYVVDGIQINSRAINDYAFLDLNPLNDINFNDIESVSILKDASASAIYGSRGANGVVLITTKRGKIGSPKVSFDYQMGMSKPTHLRTFLDGDQFVDYFTQAAINAGKYKWREGIGNFDSEQEAIDASLNSLNEDLELFSGGTTLGTVNSDWQAEAFQKATSLSSNLSVTGGTDNVRYYLGAGYSNQEGIMLKNGGKRVNILTNVDATMSSKLDAGISLNLIRDQNHDIPNDNAFATPMQIVALSPITPIYDSTGNYTNIPVTVYPNPLIDARDSRFNTVTFRAIGNTYAEFKLMPQLSLRGEAGADITNLSTDRFFGQNTQVGTSVGGYGTYFSTRVEIYDTKLLLKYQQQFHSVHNLEATAGMEYRPYTETYGSVSGEGFPSDAFKTLASATNIVDGVSVIWYYRFMSYLGRINYDYKSRYLLTFSGRYDGSSRFGPNKQYGFFPAVSAGWIISDESFWSNIALVSYLKLRASWGITGNAEIDAYIYASTYRATNYAGFSGIYPANLPNPDIGWEQTAQTDFGLEFGILKDRLNGELDYYQKNTRDLLLSVPVAATTGFGGQIQNIGKVQNHGFEAIVNAEIFVKKFKWRVSANYAMNRNKVIALASGQDLIDFGGSSDMNVIKVGEPLGILYGAEYAGVDPANGDALWYINDPENPSRETTNDFNAANFVIVGDPNPKFIGGITSTFGYKGFALDFTLQSVYGNDIVLAGDLWMNGGGATYDNPVVEALGYWQQPGDVTDVPEPRLGYNNGNQSRSSRNLSDGSYLRMKTLTLSYDFPKSLAKKMRMQSFQLYASSYNLFTVTRYEGWDPEVTSDLYYGNNTYFGIDFYSAPQPKTVVLGLRLSL